MNDSTALQNQQSSHMQNATRELLQQIAACEKQVRMLGERLNPILEVEVAAKGINAPSQAIADKAPLIQELEVYSRHLEEIQFMLISLRERLCI